MSQWLFLRWREDQVINEPGFSNLCWGEQEKRLAPLYAEWRKDILSPESWDRFSEEHKPKLTEPTDEEVMQCEHEEKESQEIEETILREKCPTCRSKCAWYKQE